MRKIAEVNRNIVTGWRGANDLNAGVSGPWLSPGSTAPKGNALADVLIERFRRVDVSIFTLPVSSRIAPMPWATIRREEEALMFCQPGFTDHLAPNRKGNHRQTGSGDPNTAVYSEESLVGYRWFDTRKMRLCTRSTWSYLQQIQYKTLSIDGTVYGKAIR